ncbi:MAG: SDR family NAD(P)-dependent oxidoreductase [Solirubrobacterales bacterium]
MGQLESKVAVITGAGRGIGRAATLAFLAAGAQVVALSRDPGELEATAGLAGDSASLEILTGDVSRIEDVEAAVAVAEDRFGNLTTIVNNAAVQTPGTVVDTPLDDFDRMMDVNVRGVFLGCRVAIPALIEGGGGSIVNIASINALVAEKNLAVYAATKGAVMMMSKAIALDYADAGIRCNAVCPGFVDTPLNVPHYESLGGRQALEDGLADFQPIGRAIRESEIADSIVFLASDASTVITGTAFVVDGGATAQ